MFKMVTEVRQNKDTVYTIKLLHMRKYVYIAECIYLIKEMYY